MPHIAGESGIDWHYRCEGAGLPLLFIHGWGVDSRVWRQQAKHFSSNFKVVRVDLPGHGESGFKKASLADIAIDLKKILNALGVEQCTVVGSSFGGMVALKLYEHHHHIFDRFIFVGSLPKFSKSADFPHGLDIERIRKLEGQVEQDYPGIVHIFFRSLFTKQERATRRYKWLQRFRRDQGAPVKAALREYLDILEKEDLRNVFRQVKIPIDFINGRQDPICDYESVLSLKELMPQAEFFFFEDCGHFPFLSQPHEFNCVLERFLIHHES
jgi:pimeloyl-[acyl-carrier protein] methyl ester esterase